MKELEKNLEATGGVPAEAELAAINRFAKSPLRAEEVYTFSLRLCDNEVDRDWERFDTAALNTLGDLFVGKSGIFDHQWTAEGQTARIYRTEMVREGAQVTAVGDGYCWLKAWAYLLRTEKNADLIAEIEGLGGRCKSRLHRCGADGGGGRGPVRRRLRPDPRARRPVLLQAHLLFHHGRRGVRHPGGGPGGRPALELKISAPIR